jgi:ketosteroid isomerase-like protein
MNNEKDVAATIISLERAALDRWGKGDPSGYLEITAQDVVYFDPFLEYRLDGLEALSRYYEALWGKIKIDRYEFINPKVQVCGDGAVLTFNLVSHIGKTQTRWNCTEVFQCRGDHWLIIQTHWSITQHLK